MKIRRIKEGHVTNCPFCKASGAKVQATWHLTGENKQACDGHRHMLEQIRDGQHKPEHYSEADYQTWLNL